MSAKGLRKATIVIFVSALLLTMTCFLSACQATPEQNAVAQKGDALEEGIKQTAPPTDQTAGENETEERWEYQKAYDSGNRLNVNAVIINKNKADIPVISVTRIMCRKARNMARIYAT